jgi:hypothetical protein
MLLSIKIVSSQVAELRGYMRNVEWPEGLFGRKMRCDA